MKLLRSGLLVAAAVVGLAVVAQAQDSPQRKELRRVDLSGAAGMEVVSSISEFKPGEELPRHLHHGVEAGYVVQGAMVQNPGQQPAMLATGAPILNLRDVVHGGFKVVGPGNVILLRSTPSTRESPYTTGRSSALTVPALRRIRRSRRNS